MNLRNTEPTQVVKALAIKPDDLGLIPSISTVAEEPTSSKLSSDLHSCGSPKHTKNMCNFKVSFKSEM